jgi:hypothetical protein
MSAIGSELGERISPSSDFEVKISSRMICEDRGQAGQDQFTPRDRSDSAVCRSEVGKQLGSIRFKLRSDANPRFPCLTPDELSLPGSREHTRSASASGAVHRKRSRDRAGRAGSFSFPSANPISGGTIRRGIFEQPAEREGPFPRNSIAKNELVFSTSRR